MGNSDDPIDLGSDEDDCMSLGSEDDFQQGSALNSIHHTAQAPDAQERIFLNGWTRLLQNGVLFCDMMPHHQCQTYFEA